MKKLLEGPQSAIITGLLSIIGTAILFYFTVLTQMVPKQEFQATMTDVKRDVTSALLIHKENPHRGAITVERYESDLAALREADRELKLELRNALQLILQRLPPNN